MGFSTEQIEVTGRLASHLADPWVIGAEASHLKQVYGLRGEDIVVIAAEEYGKEISVSTIQSTRQVYEVFGDDPILPFKFSHHKVAAHAARETLGLRGHHKLSADELAQVRATAAGILGSIRLRKKQKITGAMIQEAVDAALGGTPGLDPRDEAAGAAVPDSDAPTAEPGVGGDPSHDVLTPDPGPADAGEAPRAVEDVEPPATKTAPAHAEAQQNLPVTDQEGLELVRQLERRMSQARGRRKERLITAVAGVLQSELPTMDPEYAAKIVDQIRALAPATAAACDRADAAA